MKRGLNQSNYLVSTVILTWNSECYIKECIDSVFDDANLSEIKTEVIVVDNGSSDRTFELLENLKEEYQDLKLIRLEKNFGTTISRNIGIRNSQGKHIFILDADTILQHGVLHTLIKTIEDGKRIGIASPCLIYPDNTVQPSCKKFPTIAIKILKFLPFKNLHRIAEREELYYPEVYTKEFSEIIDVDLCSSAAWMLNRGAVNDIGLLDENIFYSPEDVDYCLRMWLNGWRVVYNPNTKLLHYSQRLSYKSFKLALLHAKGLIYYFEKYKYLFNRNRIYNRIKR